MLNKKYLLIAGLCASFGAFPAMAQEGAADGSSYAKRDMTYRGANYDVLDSNYVPKYRMKQYHQFMNHQYFFPPRPRNMWEVGLGFGLYNISGDIPSLMLWKNGGYGISAHVRKALGYTFSLRADYTYAIGKGQEWQPSFGYGNNTPWINAGYNSQSHPGPSGQLDPVFYNYRTEAHQLNLDLVAAAHNIRFNRARTGVSIYAFVGVGGLAYQTWVNAKGANGQNYAALFDAVYKAHSNNGATNTKIADRNKIRKELKNGINGLPGMDNSYESDGESTVHNRRPGLFDKKTLDFVGSFGIGAQFRVSKHVNIFVEDRLSIPVGPGDDLLDGQRWAEQTSNEPVFTQSTDGMNYLSVGINVNLGSSKRFVEPLYWLNPLDYTYNEVSTPRHMQLPEPILSDSDGDGVADQFDKCPDTPAGVAVDAHGCPIDTDGDGVPDYMDKELITPTYCQPVDADGVGKCPDPECCKEAKGQCGNINFGNITFDANSYKIKPAMQSQLAVLAAQMLANPTCKVVITGQGNSSKLQQQRSWDRVNAIMEYLIEKHGISRNRFIFQYGQPGDANAVIYRSAQPGEDGAGTLPPPHPNLH
jgi:hypothetical protein